MLDVDAIKKGMPPLQRHAWPPVQPFNRLPVEFRDFLAMDRRRQGEALELARRDPEVHGRTLHSYLDVVSAYIFGYEDSPCHGKLDDELEARLLAAKLVLERELFDHWLRPLPVPADLGDQHRAYRYLIELSQNNTSLAHPLFSYLKTTAGPQALRIFLRNEATRNEVVDDEVAMLLAGLQGPMKLAIASNLWDECGRGRLETFHTYWLRRLLDKTADWDGIRRYRREERPWFTQITTNVFNIFLTRPGVRLMAYGWFLINESWVAPHFADILAGLERIGVNDDDIAIYFKAHQTIDPIHTRELSGALAIQDPPLTAAQIALVVGGAHAAVAATTAQYDRMLGYLRELDGNVHAPDPRIDVTPPRRQARSRAEPAEAVASAISHHGELLQGAFEDGPGEPVRALVTLARPSLRAVARFAPARNAPLTVTPAWKSKAARAARFALASAGADDYGGHLELSDEIPLGYGLGSSTSDVVATIRAVLKALGDAVHPATIARLAVEAEGASDSIMFEDRTVLFAQRKGYIVEDLGPAWLPVTVLGFNTDPSGQGISTLELQLPTYSWQEVQMFRPLLGLLRAAVANRSVAYLGRVATASARINQRHLPKPRFDELERIVESSGAAGIQIAHSGTVAGLMFDADADDLEPRLDAAARRLAELDFGTTWRFTTGVMER